MAKKKRKLDIAQAIVVASVVLGVLIGGGLVLTWGPADSRAVVVEWGMAIGGVLGLLFAAFRGRIFGEADDDGTGPGAAIALLFAATAASVAFGVSGCGGVPHEVRVGVEQLAVGVDRADVLLEARIETRGEEARRQVLAEQLEGMIETVEEGMARFDELLASEAAAVAVLETVRRKLLALEAALDAWDAGSDEAGFLAALACALVALVELAAGLEAAGVDLPDELEQGLAFVRGLAAGTCPEPTTAGGEAATS